MSIIKEDFAEDVMKGADDFIKILASKVKVQDLVNNYIQFLEKVSIPCTTISSPIER